LHSHLVIRLCRHIFPDGRHCHGAAVRGRACCRHRLDARTRRHKMARSHFWCPRFAPFFWALTRGCDLALNRAEVLRVTNTDSVDFAAARLMLWALDLTALALPAEPTTRPDRARNPNVFYYKPINLLFSRSCTQNPSQIPENKRGQGRGVSQHSRFGNLTRERVGCLQPRRDAI
jgi:hypothetical protein